MKTIICAFLLWPLLFCAPAHAAEATVWIEPGESVGPARIGLTVSELVSAIGPPQNAEKNFDGYSYFLDYPAMYIEASLLRQISDALKGRKDLPSREEFAKLKHKVVWITTYDSSARTRGNIGVGSSFVEVLKAFGDTSVRIAPDSGRLPSAIQCSEASVVKAPGHLPSSLRDDGFSGYVLTLDYDSEGIDFHFKVGQGEFKVFAITVSDRKQCKRVE